MPATTTAVPPATLDWGRTRYTDAWRRQERLVVQRIAGEIGDTLVFTEHEPVFTIGLRRSVRYGLGCLATAVQFRLAKMRLLRPRIFPAAARPAD